MRRGWIKIIMLMSAGIWARWGFAQAQKCADCHSGESLPPTHEEVRFEISKPAPKVEIPAYSAHYGMECIDCHTQADIMPHPPEMPPVNCNICHSGEVSDLGSASHGAKLQNYLTQVPPRRDKVKLSEICLACHGEDAHLVRKSEDPLSPTFRSNIYKTCLKCHEKVEPIAIKQYLESVHGKNLTGGKLESAVCSDCHGTHSIDHSKLQSSRVYREAVPDTCGKCHPQAGEEYKKSIHWSRVQKGFKDAPVCTDCHGEHGIRSHVDPSSPTFATKVTMTCAHCHESELINAKYMIPKGRVQTFLNSFHGLSSSLGDVRVANCASCHGNHEILPSANPNSSINQANLGKTCGKCHPGAEKRFISEPIHKRRESNLIVTWVRNFYIIIISLIVTGMLAHNSLDMAFKVTQGVPFHKKNWFLPRLNLNERVQHFALFLLFSILAYSGFALKFPDSIIAFPFQFFSGGPSLRRWLHRGAAIAFGFLVIYHLCYLTLTKRGREQFKAIFPALRDLRDVFKLMAKYLRRFPDKPIELPHFSYIEKAEYWALVWGSAIMIITGLLLTLINFTLANMPLWVINLAETIHFYEAVLAVSAILVWHGYWSVFDPEIYPMNWTWILGKHFPPKVRRAELVGEEGRNNVKLEGK